MPTAPRPTVDDAEIAKFAALAHAWWDPNGAYRPLHKLNPARLLFLRDALAAHFGCDTKAARPLAGLRLVDIGCGGGILSEPLCRLGAEVIGIDAATENVAAAESHARELGLDVRYRAITAEELAAEGASFDAAISMEVIEHVADLGAFLAAASALVRPGGAMALATLNRTLKSLALGVVAAEYVLGWLPRGTHDWKRFVRPSELARHLRANGLAPKTLAGVGYNPISDTWAITPDLGVNYMVFATKSA
ncbi:MAG: bifunctional 2-polyprenyl-6-hydroxyphenol methylase/3-demethylubiquinol 3-O-methyltransferase UbiG [Alphaproteobacteria bacterium]